ncbi:MAG: hypothetical protein MHMPM18_000783 [Marteilia pararefringens]
MPKVKGENVTYLKQIKRFIELSDNKCLTVKEIYDLFETEAGHDLNKKINNCGIEGWKVIILRESIFL